MYGNFESSPESLKQALAPGVFPQFVMKCASQYWQQSQDTDTSGFYPFSPSGREGPGSAKDHALRQFNAAEQKLTQTLRLSEEDLTAATQEYNQQELKKYLLKRAQNRHLLANIKSWEPPTDEDGALKTFMLDKIDDPSAEDHCAVIESIKLDEQGYIDMLLNRVNESMENVENAGVDERARFMGRISTSLKGY